MPDSPSAAHDAGFAQELPARTQASAGQLPVRRAVGRGVQKAALPEVHVRTRDEWRRWLTAHHEQPGSIWLVYPRKDHRDFADLTYGALVEEALCFGWIDSVPRKRDDGNAMLRLSPRRAGSAWSRANKLRVVSLTHDGRMTAAGLAKVAEAKRDGSWTALDAVEALEVPDDLARALAGDVTARRNFDAFPPGARKAILTWIAGARRPTTRAARIAEAVRLAATNQRANVYRPRAASPDG